MDYAKVDAGLANALAGAVNPEARNLSVFIQTAEAPTEEQVSFLRRCGITNAAIGRQTLTGTVSAQAVAQLSEQRWIRYLKLASKLRALG